MWTCTFRRISATRSYHSYDLVADMDFAQCNKVASFYKVPGWTRKTYGRRYDVVALNCINVCKFMHCCTYDLVVLTQRFHPMHSQNSNFAHCFHLGIVERSSSSPLDYWFSWRQDARVWREGTAATGRTRWPGCPRWRWWCCLDDAVTSGHSAAVGCSSCNRQIWRSGGGGRGVDRKK